MDFEIAYDSAILIGIVLAFAVAIGLFIYKSQGDENAD